MTPGEIADTLAGHEMAREERQQDAIAAAWLTAALTRARRLPDPERLLRRKGRTDGRAPEERRRDHKELVGELGG